MSSKRRFGVLAAVLVLSTTLFAGNVIVAGHRTVLDPGFVKATFAEEDAYAALDERLVSEGELPVVDAENGSAPPFATEVAGRAVTPAYLRNQTEINVDRTYAYLHGGRDELFLAVDPGPVVERTDEAVAATLREAPVGALVERVGGEAAVPGDAPVDAPSLVDLAEGPAAYDETRGEFRDTLRERAVDRLANESYGRLSDDERLALVVEGYDPRNYTEAEKDRLVAEREAEIRATFRGRIEERRGDEIDRRIGDRMDEVRAAAREEVGKASTGTNERVDAEFRDLLFVFVDGLTVEGLEYPAFRDRLDAAKADLGTALGDHVRDRFDAETPDRLVLSDDLDAGTRQTVADARTAVRILDVLGVALPLAAAALVGLLWLLSRSPAAVSLWTGAAALVGGLPGLAVAGAIGDRLGDAVVRSAPDSGAGSVLSAVGAEVGGGLAGALSAQSLALSAAGAVLVAVGLVLRSGVGTDRRP